MKLSSLLERASHSRSRLGFTMIELLVVIAIIGILAASVLAALNPVEAINRSRDTSVKADAASLLSVIDTYYVSNQAYPWADPQPAGSAYDPTGANFPSSNEFYVGANNTYTWLSAPEMTGELKTGLRQRLAASAAGSTYDIHILKVADGNTGVGSTVFACFYPISRTIRQEALNDCTNNKAPGSPSGPALPTGSADPCPATPTLTNVMLCLP